MVVPGEPEELNSPEAKIQVVIVLYRSSIEASSTCTSMQAQRGYCVSDVSFLIYDNSPTAASFPIPPGWRYRSDPRNQGLSSAYNHALCQAEETGCAWLLLLDQDSSLPQNFLANLLAEVRGCCETPEIVAIVPRIISNNRHISPVRPMFGLDLPYRLPTTTPSGWISAINSATSVRVSFLRAIGGFSNTFWLDYLDHWLFRRIYDCGKRVFVGAAIIEHELSVANFNRGLNVDRYRNILIAEATFANEFLPLYWQLILVPRLVARALKHSLFTRNKRMCLLMLSAAWSQGVTIFRRWV